MNGRSALNKVQLFKQLIRDPERKSIPTIVRELMYLSLVFKTIPSHYFSRYLFKRDRTNIKDYFPGKVLYGIKPHFNDVGAREVLENKLFFDFFYSELNIKLPKIVMYNHRNVFVVDKKVHQVTTVYEFKSLLQLLVKNYNIKDSIFIKRTYGTYGGAKIFKFYLSQLETDSQSVIDLFHEVIQTGYLFQETVRQHPEMNKLNSSCLNTIRMDTFIDRDGKIEIISAGLRTSLTNNHVDNVSSGGYY